MVRYSSMQYGKNTVNKSESKHLGVPLGEVPPVGVELAARDSKEHGLTVLYVCLYARIYTVLYCIVLYYTVLILLYCTVLYSTVLYCI